MNNETEVQYTTEYFKEKHNIKVEGFDIGYVTFQGSGSITCPAHAAATMLNCYYGENKFVYKSFWSSKDDTSGSFNTNGDGNNKNHEHDDAINTIASDFKSSDDEYLDQIKHYLDSGVPVELVVWDNNAGNTHFVVAIGYDELDINGRIVFDKLVITDSGTSQEAKAVCNMGDSHDKSDYVMYNNRIIAPKLLDSGGQYVHDENEDRTTDLYYIDPVRKADGSIIPAYAGRPLKEAIASVNSSLMSDEDKEEKINGLIKLFTGEGGEVYENLTVSENGEYLPEDGVTAFDKVTVNVPLAKLGVSENGEYHASERGVAGFDTVTVNVTDRYKEGYQKGCEDTKKAQDIENSECGPDEILDPQGGGKYRFQEGAVTGLTSDNIGSIAVRLAAKGIAYITDTVHGRVIKYGMEYRAEQNDWRLILEQYNAKTGTLITNNSKSWNDVRGGGNDDVRISQIEVLKGYYMVVSVNWHKYNVPSSYTADVSSYTRWVYDGAEPNFVVSGTAPVYIADN